MTFWQGFIKQAAKDTKPPKEEIATPVEKLFKWDPVGGIASRSPEEAAAAQQADLVTFAKGVPGASCVSCQFLSPLDKREGINYGFCTKLNRFVTEKQGCNLWDAPGTFREFAQPDTAVVTPEDHAAHSQEQAAQSAQAAAAGGQEAAFGAVDGMMPPPAPGMVPEQMPGLVDEMSAANMGEPMPPQAGGEGAPAPAEKKPEKKEKPKKDKDADKGSEAKHTINIHVGGKGEKK